jgi:ABC-type bacteriocin/lantibiotic exporter with double-glycine peptidase domain
MSKTILVPDVRQVESFDCGAAATDAVCRYFGRYKPRAYYKKLLGTNGINGTDPRTIESFLRGEKLKVLSGDMEIKDLQQLTAAGRPVITLVTFDESGHYIVVTGVDRGRVRYNDPDGGKKSISIGSFISSWVDIDRFGVVYRQFGVAVWR